MSLIFARLKRCTYQAEDFHKKGPYTGVQSIKLMFRNMPNKADLADGMSIFLLAALEPQEGGITFEMQVT